jgi:hypothetical protein
MNNCNEKKNKKNKKKYIYIYIGKTKIVPCDNV